MTQIAEPAHDERSKVEGWRLHVLIEAGYPLPLAEKEFHILQQLNGGKPVSALGDDAAEHVRRLAENGVVDLLPQG